MNVYLKGLPDKNQYNSCTRWIWAKTILAKTATCSLRISSDPKRTPDCRPIWDEKGNLIKDEASPEPRGTNRTEWISFYKSGTVLLQL